MYLRKESSGLSGWQENDMKHSIKAVAAGAMAALAFNAHATFVTDWSYSVSAEWVTSNPGAPTFTSGTGVQVKTTNEISWGGSNGGLNPYRLIIGSGNRSGIRILHSPQTGSVTTNSLAAGAVATFQHVNNAISGSYATLKTATVKVNLTLTPTAPSGPAQNFPSLTFKVNFTETPNTAGTCIPEATSVCDDIFVLTTGNLNQSFTYDGETYYVSFLDLQSGPLQPLSTQACQQAGATYPCLGFWTAEGAAETIDFGLVVTGHPVEIPEPGVLALSALGLLTAAGASRRRRKR